MYVGAAGDVVVIIDHDDTDNYIKLTTGSVDINVEFCDVDGLVSLLQRATSVVEG